MKRLLMVLVVLAIVAGMSFAVEVGGSTAVAGIGNPDEKVFQVDQEIDIDLDALHFDVNGGLDYLVPEKDWMWDYEIGASYTILIFTFGSTVAGDKDVKLGDITLYADITPCEQAGVDIDFLFSADETKDAFRGADFSMFYNPGPCEFRVGYLWTENALPDINAPELLANGGFYVKAKISY